MHELIILSTISNVQTAAVTLGTGSKTEIASRTNQRQPHWPPSIREANQAIHLNYSELALRIFRYYAPSCHVGSLISSGAWK